MSSSIAEGSRLARPYRGPQSYSASDQALFFGRENDAGPLVSIILSNGLSLLHAVSGVGKSSLLEALVLPMLEEQGWTTVRARPHQHPVESLKRDIFERVLPNPEDECRAIDKTLAIMARHDRGPSATLGELDVWEVPAGTEDFRSLRTFSPGDRGGSQGPETVQTTPYVTRFFQYRTGLEILERHVTAFASLSGTTPPSDIHHPDGSLSLANWSFEALKDFFSNPLIVETYAALRRSLNIVGMPLDHFLQRMQWTWGRRIEGFGLVIVLDQFEEMFTRYTGERGKSRAADLLDWELRPVLFKAIGSIVRPVEATSSLPPLRFVISMRDDFIARLDDLAKEAGTIDGDARYHLQPLSKKAAARAIVRPAQLFGVRYEDALLDELLTDLATEKAWIHPGHLQIVCEYLWEKTGGRFAVTGGEIRQEDMPKSRDQHGVSLILQNHFQHVLDERSDGVARKVSEKLEILDLLEPLMIKETRNIVGEDRLVQAPYRNVALRRELLAELSKARIVRTEPRLGGLFVEITHEFLIPAIRQAITTTFHNIEDRELWRQLQAAFDKLGDIQRTFRMPGARLLDREELVALNHFSGLVDFVAHPWVAEAMYRSALRIEATRELVAGCLARMEKYPVTVDGEALLDSLEERRRAEILLDGLEVAAFLALGDGVRPDHDVRTFVLRSAIANARSGESHLIESALNRVLK